MKKRYKILVVSDLFPLNDTDYTGIYVADYANCVQPWFDVEIFHPRLVSEQPGISEKQLFGLKVTRYTHTDQPVGKLQKLIAYRSWFRKAAQIGNELGKFDLIHAHGATLAGNVAQKIAKLQNIPYVVTEHTGPFSTISSNSMRLKFCKSAVAKACALLNVSQHSQNEMNSAGVSHSEQQVTYNPVNDKIFQPADPAEIKKQFIFVSRLDEFKGGLRTVTAFHQTGLEKAGWSLVMIGEGEEQESIKSYIQQHSLQSVQLTGFLTKSAIAKGLRESAAMVFPSRHETFGLVAAESLICGAPVISTNRTAPAEFTDETNAIAIDPDSIDEIKVAMLQIAEGNIEFNRKSIAQNAIHAFGMEAFGTRLKELYLRHIRD